MPFESRLRQGPEDPEHPLNQHRDARLAHRRRRAMQGLWFGVGAIDACQAEAAAPLGV